ncbi:Protein kinase domain [Leishmania braziliensis]|nr:Protein kinase domain [Leishmania braziliensis]
MQGDSVKVGSSSQSPKGSATCATEETLKSLTAEQAVMNGNGSTVQAGSVPHLVKNVTVVAAITTAAESASPMQSPSPSLGTSSAKSEPGGTSVLACNNNWQKWGSVRPVSLCGAVATAVSSPPPPAAAAAEPFIAPSAKPLTPPTRAPLALPGSPLPFTLSVVTPVSGSSAAAEVNMAPAVEALLEKRSERSTNKATISVLCPTNRGSVAFYHDLYRRRNSNLGVSCASSAPLLLSTTSPLAMPLGCNNKWSDDSAAVATDVMSPLSLLFSRHGSDTRSPPLLTSQIGVSVPFIGEVGAPFVPPATSPQESATPQQPQQQQPPADVMTRLKPSLLLMAQALCSCPFAEVMCPVLIVENSGTHIAAATTINAAPANSPAANQISTPTAYTTTEDADSRAQQRTLPLSLGLPPYHWTSSGSPHHADFPQPQVESTTVFDIHENKMTEGCRGAHHQSTATVASGDVSDVSADGEGDPETNSTRASNIPGSISQALIDRVPLSSYSDIANTTTTAAIVTGNLTPAHGAFPQEQLTSDSATPPRAWPLVYANDAAVSMLGYSDVEEVTAGTFDNLFSCFALTLPPNASSGSNSPFVTAAATDLASVPIALASLFTITSSSSSRAAHREAKEMNSNDEGDEKGPKKHEQSSSNALRQPGWREVKNPDELLALSHYNYIILYCERTSAYYAALAVPSYQPKISQRTSMEGKRTLSSPPLTAASAIMPAAIPLATNAKRSLMDSSSTTWRQSLRSTTQHTQPHLPAPKKLLHPSADGPSSRLTNSEEVTAVEQCERRTPMPLAAASTSPPLGPNLSSGTSPSPIQQQKQQQQQRHSRYVAIYILQRLESSNRAAGDAKLPGVRPITTFLDRRLTAVFELPPTEAPHVRSSQPLPPSPQRSPCLPLPDAATATARVNPFGTGTPHALREQYVSRSQQAFLLPVTQTRRPLPNSSAERSINRTASRTSGYPGSPAPGVRLAFGSSETPSSNSDGASAMQSTSQHTNQNSLFDLSYPLFHVNLAQPTSASLDCLYGASEPACAALLAATVAGGAREQPFAQPYKPEEAPHHHLSSLLSQKTTPNARQPPPKQRYLLSRQRQQRSPVSLYDKDATRTVAQFTGSAITDLESLSPVRQPASGRVSRKCNLLSAPLSAANATIALLNGTRSRTFCPLYQPLCSPDSGCASLSESPHLQSTVASTTALIPAVARSAPWCATQEVHSGETVVELAQQARDAQKHRHKSRSAQVAALVGVATPSAWARRGSHRLSPFSVSPLNSYASPMYHSLNCGGHLSPVGGGDAADFGGQSPPQRALPGAMTGARHQQQPSSWVNSMETSVTQQLGNAPGAPWQRCNEVDHIMTHKLADRLLSQRSIVAVLVSPRLPHTIIFNSFAFMMFVQHVLRFQYRCGVTQVACILNMRLKTQLVIDIVPVEVLMRTSGCIRSSGTDSGSCSTSPASHNVSVSWRGTHVNADRGDRSLITTVEAGAAGRNLAAALPSASKAQPSAPVLVNSLPSSKSTTSPQQQKILELLGLRLKDLNDLLSYEESREALSPAIPTLDSSFCDLLASRSSSSSGPFTNSCSRVIPTIATVTTTAASSLDAGVTASSLPWDSLQSLSGGSKETRSATPLRGLQPSRASHAAPCQPRHGPLRHSVPWPYNSHPEQEQQQAKNLPLSPNPPIAEVQRIAVTSHAAAATMAATVPAVVSAGCSVQPNGHFETLGVAAAQVADGDWMKSVVLSRPSSLAATTNSGTVDVAREDNNSSSVTSSTSETSHTPDPAFSEARALEVQQNTAEEGDNALSQQHASIEEAKGCNVVVESATENSSRSLPSNRTSSGKQSLLWAYSGVGSASKTAQQHHPHRRPPHNVPSSDYLSRDVQESLAMCDGAIHIRADTYEAQVQIPFTTPQRLELLSQLGNVQLSKYRGLSVFGANLVNMVTEEAAAEAAQPSPQIIPLRYDIAARPYLEGVRGRSVVISPLASPTNVSQSSLSKLTRASANGSATETNPTRAEVALASKGSGTAVVMEAAENASVTNTSAEASALAAGLVASIALPLRPPALQASASIPFAAAASSGSAKSHGWTVISSKDASPEHTSAPSMGNSSSATATPSTVVPVTSVVTNEMMSSLSTRSRGERATVSVGAVSLRLSQLVAANTSSFSFTQHGSTSSSEGNFPAADMLSVASTEVLPKAEGVAATPQRGSAAAASGAATLSQHHADPLQLLMDLSPTAGTHHSTYRRSSILSMATADDRGDEHFPHTIVEAAARGDAMRGMEDGKRRLSGSVGKRTEHPNEGDTLRRAASFSDLTVSGTSLPKKGRGLQLPAVLLACTIATAEGKQKSTAAVLKTEKERLTVHSGTNTEMASMEVTPQLRRSSTDTTAVSETRTTPNTAGAMTMVVVCSPPQRHHPQVNLTPHSRHHAIESSTHTAVSQSPVTSSQELQQTPLHVEPSMGQSWSAGSESPPVSQSSNILSASCAIRESSTSVTAKGWAERTMRSSLSGTPSAQEQLSVSHPILSCTTPLAVGNSSHTDLISTRSSETQSLFSVCTQKSGVTELLGYTLSNSAAAAFGDFSTALEKESDEHEEDSAAASSMGDKEVVKKTGASAAVLRPLTTKAPDAELCIQQYSCSGSLSAEVPKSVMVTGTLTHVALPSTLSTTLTDTAAAQPTSPEAKPAGLSSDKGGRRSSDSSGSVATLAAARVGLGAGGDWHASSGVGGNSSLRDEVDDSFADSFMDIFGLVSRPQQLKDLRHRVSTQLRSVCDRGFVSTGTTAAVVAAPAAEDPNPGAHAAMRDVWGEGEAADPTTRNNLHVLVYATRAYPEVEEVLGIYGHCATFATSAAKMLRYARSGMQLFDVVIVEWTDSLISAEIHDLLVKHAVEATVVAFFISTRPDVHAPAMNTDNVMTDEMVVMHADNLLEGLLSRSVLEEVQQLIRRRQLMHSMISVRKDQSFQIHSHIGSGAFGDVFEVMMYVSRGKLAMKRIFLKSMKLRQLEIINREVSIMRALEHPNIVSFSHTRLEDNAYSIFMELCDGTLADHLLEPSVAIPGAAERQQNRSDSGAGLMAEYPGNARCASTVFSNNNSISGSCTDGKGDVPGVLQTAACVDDRADSPGSDETSITAPELTRPQDAVMIVHDIASALSYLHRRGIVHRDIKPANVLFSNGMAKLGDFGSAAKMTESRKLHNMKGTVSYMAPEIVLGEPYTESCDLWSFGCLIASIMGINLGHLNGLHMPALNELYRTIPRTGSLPLTFTNRLSLRIANHYTEATTNRVLTAFKRALEVDTAERQQGASPKSHSSVNAIDTTETKNAQNSSQQPTSIDYRALQRTDTTSTTSEEKSRYFTESEGTGSDTAAADMRNRSRRTLCITMSSIDVMGESYALLPASLVELFNRLFHRDPTERMTAAEVLDHQVSWDVEWMARMMREVYNVSCQLTQSNAEVQGTAGGASQCHVVKQTHGGRPPPGEEGARTGAATPSVTTGDFACFPIQSGSGEPVWMAGGSGGRRIPGAVGTGSGAHIPSVAQNYVLDLSLSGNSSCSSNDSRERGSYDEVADD